MENKDEQLSKVLKKTEALEEQLSEALKKAEAYEKLDHQFRLICNEGVQGALQNIAKFGLAKFKITEQQALNKIAERFPMTTEQIISVLESSLTPVAPFESVEVPGFVASWYEKNKDYPLSSKFMKAQHAESEKIQNWYDNCKGRHANKRANAQEIIAKMDLYGYKVVKEPLYYMPVPYLDETYYVINESGMDVAYGIGDKFMGSELDKYFPDIKKLAVLVEEEAE